MTSDQANSNNNRRSPSPYRSRADQSMSDFLHEFWQHTINTAENSSDDFKHQSLPLARIKKVMKSDPDVCMVSSEVTMLFEKACQVFIQELTARAHLVSLSSRRRTLSRPDVAQAISKSDMFDFLIDIVPRESSSSNVGDTHKRQAEQSAYDETSHKHSRFEDPSYANNNNMLAFTNQSYPITNDTYDYHTSNPTWEVNRNSTSSSNSSANPDFEFQY